MSLFDGCPRLDEEKRPQITVVVRKWAHHLGDSNKILVRKVYKPSRNDAARDILQDLVTVCCNVVVKLWLTRFSCHKDDALP